ncbi:hypothetical protein N9J11_02530, partial [Actinomycetota bacterium]|nr:hypothetical protein [Actinomycetota bacterium]
NNVYCQDNDLSWLNWNLEQQDWDLIDFVATVAHIRRSHPMLCPLDFYSGEPLYENGPKDLAWFGPDAQEITDWHDSEHVSIGMFLTPRESGEESIFAIFHVGSEPVKFTLPAHPYAQTYVAILDTHATNGQPNKHAREAGEVFLCQPRSTYVLTAQR